LLILVVRIHAFIALLIASICTGLFAGMDPQSSGATFLSHVNDSGFWLVSQYLGLTEKQTFRSWSVMTMIVGVVGLLCAGLIFGLS
jgi:H+/gluconate symporter-like permease